MKQRIPSPFQYLSYEEQVAKTGSQLLAIHEKVLTKIDELKGMIEEVKNIKKEPKQEQRKQVISPTLNSNKPVRGKDYFTAKDINDFIRIIESRMRVPLDGVSIPGPKPVKGVDYMTDEDKEEMAGIVLSRIKKPENGKDAIIDPDIMMGMLTKSKKKLSSAHIDGLEQTISAVVHQLSRGYLHGGGDTVRAGSNITITRNTDGTTSISSSGGSGTWYQDEVLIRTNGTNYTLAHTPTAVVLLYLNGQLQISGTDYTRVGTAVTMTTPTLVSDTLTATYS